MKKLLLIGCLILIAACQSADSTPSPDPAPTPTLLPTPVPDTPIPTIPPAPTVSPTPEPPPPYFTDEFDFPSPYWDFFQTGGTLAPSAIFESGMLRIDIPSADTWWMGIHNAHAYADVFVRAKADAGAPGAMGLVCRYRESNGWYEFNVASDGTYNALYGQWLAPEIAKYIPLIPTGGGRLNIASPGYEIGLSCRENFLNLYVNGALIRRVDVTNFGLADGNIGATASSFREAPMIVLFEWVRVGQE
jgi:hypothetical protein